MNVKEVVGEYAHILLVSGLVFCPWPSTHSAKELDCSMRHEHCPGRPVVGRRHMTLWVVQELHGVEP